MNDKNYSSKNVYGLEKSYNFNFENIQSIFFLKEFYTIDQATKILIDNNLIFKRINIDQYYFRFTFQSRLQLQKQNYIKKITYIDDNKIKIESYIAPKNNNNNNISIASFTF